MQSFRKTPFLEKSYNTPHYRNHEDGNTDSHRR